MPPRRAVNLTGLFEKGGAMSLTINTSLHDVVQTVVFVAVVIGLMVMKRN